MISRPFSSHAWLTALKRRDPPASAHNRCRKHFASGIIPLLLCKTLAFLLWRHASPGSRDTIPMKRVRKLWGKSNE
jgi:hypothetical protein